MCCWTVGRKVNPSVLKEAVVAYSTYSRRIFMVERRGSTKSSVRLADDLAHGCSGQALAATAKRCCPQKQRQQWGNGSTISPCCSQKQRQQWDTGSTISPCCSQKQRQQWDTGSTISPMLLTKNRGNSGALVAPSHHVAYKNRGNCETLAETAHNYFTHTGIANWLSTIFLVGDVCWW